jgi:hypothetical protein
MIIRGTGNNGSKTNGKRYKIEMSLTLLFSFQIYFDTENIYLNIMINNLSLCNEWQYD